MTTMKLHKGDHIQMITGNDKGKTGKILSVNPEAATIVVEGINLRKKHRRAKQQGRKGEIVSVPARFPASRAMLYCPTCQKGARSGNVTGEDETKKRVCKRCHEVL